MSEQTYYSADGVRVTSTRLIVDSTTYYLKNVNSAGVTETPRSYANDPGLFMIGLGVLLGVTGIIALTVDVPLWGGLLWFVVSGSLVIGGYKLMGRGAKKYVLLVTTTGGESQALSADSRDWLQCVLDAMNRAIAGEAPPSDDEKPQLKVAPEALKQITCTCCGHVFQSEPGRKHLCPRCRTSIRVGESAKGDARA